MFVRKKKYQKMQNSYEAKINALLIEMEDRKYFCDLGRKAAQRELNGITNGLLIGHGKQYAADKLGIFSKKWDRAFMAETKKWLNSMREEHGIQVQQGRKNPMRPWKKQQESA